MIRVGLTGGIGSGKTMVAKIFEVLGIPVYYADEAARSIMNDDEELKKKLVEVFGEQTYREGLLDRAWLGSQVFNDPARLAMLNSLTHPATILHSNDWMNRQLNLKVPYAIKEAALIFESGSAKHLDFVIGVHTPVALRIKRLMDRDGFTAEQVKDRMDRQMDESIKMKLCDVVIVNDALRALIPQVQAIHANLLQQDGTDHPGTG